MKTNEFVREATKGLMVCCAATCLSGCLWSRMRMNDPDILVRAQSIRPGVTKTVDLPGLLLAQPTRQRSVGNTVISEYSFADAKTKLFSVIIFTLSRTENVTETLYVESDKATGLVTKVPHLVHRDPEWLLWPFDD